MSAKLNDSMILPEELSNAERAYLRRMNRVALGISPSRTSAQPIVNPRACQVVSAGATDTGLERSGNEDRFRVVPEVGLYVVADGMGGAKAGEIAAQMAVQLVGEAVLDPTVAGAGKRERGSLGLPLLVAAIEHANTRIYTTSRRVPSMRGMGTTIVALLACGDRVAIAHVGDSRIYRLRGRRLDLLTEDHSLFNELARHGLIDPDHPEDFEYRHVLTRSLGTGPRVEVEGCVIDVQPGDTFLLCSDGLSGVVSHGEMTSVLRETRNLDDAAERLIDRANDKGGPDNVTAVLVRWDSTGARAGRATS